MTTHRDPDMTIAAWLDDGPIELPEATRRAIAVGIRSQPRAGRLASPGGIAMHPFTRLAAAAALVAAVGLTAVLVLSNRGGGPGLVGSPVPSASSTSGSAAAAGSTTSPTASATGGLTASPPPPVSTPPSPTPFTVPTVFTSPSYGYSVKLPPGWLVVPAQTTWEGTSAPGDDDPRVDQWIAPHVQNRCARVFLCAPTLWAFAGPTTLDLRAFVAAQDAAALRDHQCTIPPSSTTIRIDGQAATLEDGHCGSGGPLVLGAFTVRNGIGYAFSLQENTNEAHVESLDRADFASLLATVHLGR